MAANRMRHCSYWLGGCATMTGRREGTILWYSAVARRVGDNWSKPGTTAKGTGRSRESWSASTLAAVTGSNRESRDGTRSRRAPQRRGPRARARAGGQACLQRLSARPPGQGFPLSRIPPASKRAPPQAGPRTTPALSFYQSPLTHRRPQIGTVSQNLDNRPGQPLPPGRYTAAPPALRDAHRWLGPRLAHRASLTTAAGEWAARAAAPGAAAAAARTRQQ